ESFDGLSGTAATGSALITVPAGVYPLTLGELVVSGAGTLTIQGSGGSAVLDPNALSRVLHNTNANGTTLTNLTITRGLAPGRDGGGGILNEGRLTLADGVTVADNIAALQGGGIENRGSLLVQGATLSGNRAGAGGGLFNSGDSLLVDASVASNSASTT